MNIRAFWLTYKRLRPAMGTSFGFVLMYAIFTQNMTYQLFLIAVSYFFIHLFGDCYNDYYDIEEDVRNERSDKLILNNLISPKKLYHLSIVFLAVGLSLLAFVNSLLLLPGLWYAFLLFSYSYPKIRIKKYNIGAYLLGGSVWVFTFLVLDFILLRQLSLSGIFLTIFCFSQFVFILCQKDSTDKNDEFNLFLSKDMNKSFRITAFFASISSVSLLFLSNGHAYFIIFWALNFSSKFLNLNNIRRNLITRSERSKLVLLEFLTPYLYVGGGIIV